MELKLKPCPFCGSKVIIAVPYSFKRGSYFIECDDCGICTRTCTNEHKAAEVWNTRHNEPPQVDEVPPLDAQRRESIVEVFTELRQVIGHQLDHINSPDDLLD